MYTALWALITKGGIADLKLFSGTELTYRAEKHLLNELLLGIKTAALNGDNAFDRAVLKIKMPSICQLPDVRN